MLFPTTHDTVLTTYLTTYPYPNDTACGLRIKELAYLCMEPQHRDQMFMETMACDWLTYLVGQFPEEHPSFWDRFIRQLMSETNIYRLLTYTGYLFSCLSTHSVTFPMNQQAYRYLLIGLSGPPVRASPLVCPRVRQLFPIHDSRFLTAYRRQKPIIHREVITLLNTRDVVLRSPSRLYITLLYIAHMSYLARWLIESDVFLESLPAEALAIRQQVILRYHALKEGS